MRRKAGTRATGLRGLIHNIRRSRGDTRGLTLSEPVIVILLLAIFGTFATVQIVFYRGEGQKTVARVNLESAVLAAESVHNFSAAAEFDSATIAADIQRVSPELAVTLHEDQVSIDSAQKGGVGICSDVNHTTPSDCTTAGGTWTAGSPMASGAMAVMVNTGAITGGTGATAYTIDANDALWLLNRSENGDTYCAFVVAEIEGDTANSGTWYDARLSENSAATCGAGPSVTSFPTGLQRSIPDPS